MSIEFIIINENKPFPNFLFVLYIIINGKANII